MFVCVFAKTFPALASQSCCEVSRPRAVGEYEYRLASLEIQEEVRAEIWQSNVRVGSNITPKSLTESVGKSSFLRKESLKLSGVQIICQLPNTMSFVSSGFNRR